MKLSRKRIIQLSLLLLVVVVIAAGVVVVKNIISSSNAKTYTLAWHFYNIGFPDETISLTPLQPAHSLEPLGNAVGLDFTVQNTFSSLKLNTNDALYACVQGVTPLLYADQKDFPGLYLAVFATCGQIAQAPGVHGRGLQPQLAQRGAAPRLYAMFTFHQPSCSVYKGDRPGEIPNYTICFPFLNGEPVTAPSSALNWDLKNAAYANQVIPLDPITPARPLSSLTHLIGVTLLAGTVSFVTTEAAYQCDVGVAPTLYEDKVAYPALFIVAYHLCTQDGSSTDSNLYAVFTFSTPPCSIDSVGEQTCFFFKESPTTPTP